MAAIFRPLADGKVGEKPHLIRVVCDDAGKSNILADPTGRKWYDMMNSGKAAEAAMDIVTRLRAINIEHSRLLKNKSAQDHFARMAALRSERAIVLGLLAGDGELRLVSNQDSLLVSHRQSA